MVCGMISQELDALLLRELQTDAPYGDKTTEAVGLRKEARTVLLAKQDLVVAGLPAALRTFELADAACSWVAMCEEGARVPKGTVMAEIVGPVPALLLAERTALNLLQRLCGIATATARAVAAVEGTAARVLDTRKTTPGLRNLEKYAVRMGGGQNHRMGLSDGILLKDNHIAAAGSVTAALAAAHNRAGALWKVEVEVADLEKYREALSAGAEVILLDNMSDADMAQAVAERPRGVLLEASGGMTLERLRRVADLGVDCISMGALTHSAPAVDISMELVPVR
jgi:nicotinate-nucleotide pyrophosphorylase (carboxylating)